MHITLLILAYCAHLLTYLVTLARTVRMFYNPALRKRKISPIPAQPVHAGRKQAKPDWVKHEVIRLRAIAPDLSCRNIENIFNRRYAAKCQITISKSYVSYTLRNHQYEVRDLRRLLKRRIPRPAPKNHLWAIDLTGKNDVYGNTHNILGIVDHGSRKLLTLEAVHNKNAWTLLAYLFIAIGQFGKPRAIRSDNESIFKGRVFHLVLTLLGICHQFITPGCPWMNGRIERAFGTLKNKLDQIKIDGRNSLAQLLAEFSFWYNATRPHQHLNGLTPDEAWFGIDPYARAPKSEQFYSGWGGLLHGVLLRY